MKLVTWNVNSLNVRLPHVLDWLRDNQPDVLCLQETKQEDIKFPYLQLKEAGYNAIHLGQKTYNGVAIISPHTINDVEYGINGFDDEQRRVISATVNDIRVVCVYIPNGQAVDSDKYAYKLRWLQALTTWLKGELERYPNLVLLGDYNIAPDDRDCHDPAAWIGQILVSELEREAFQALTQLGLHDSFRLFEADAGHFSWWDYRMNAFRRKMGMRIDLVLASKLMADQCKASYVDIEPRRQERPSDHAPAIAEFSA